MSKYSLSHLSDRDLLRDLASLVARDRSTMAEILAHIAEVDSRRLYLSAAYPSMFAYCVHELRLSEDAAYKRIQVARVARRFPAIFDAVADGRLHLIGLGLLAPYLISGNAAGLLEAASHKTKAEVDQLLAARFPKSEMLALVEAVPAAPAGNELALKRVGTSGPPAGANAAEHVNEVSCQLAPAQVGTSTPAQVGRSARARVEAPRAPVAPIAKVAPIAAQRFALHVTIDQATRDMLRHAQELLSHQIPAGEVAEVLRRALHSLITALEKRKIAATDRPQKAPRATSNRRHVPAAVKRAVWERDQGQCTFVSESGQRCPARSFLEFDHIDEVARGGRATVERMRLRCRAHNQYGAECAFGTEFMKRKREASRSASRVAPAGG